MMIAYRTKERALFLLGFAKNEWKNISPDELAALRKPAEVWLHTPDPQITKASHEGVLHEVFDDDYSAWPGHG